MKLLLFAACMAAAFGLNTLEAKINVDRIDPPHWWAGMKSASLQLQVHGQDIRNSNFILTPYSGVTVDSVVRLDGSPNWQYIYLNITPQAKPGTLTLQWKDGKQTISKKYELRRRNTRGAAGFTAADVLYMVMPDRFSDGNPDNNRVASMNYPIGADRSNLNVRHGGDLKGLMNHIDYIDSLGITALWLNPVLENDMPGGSYHGYATTDYYKIDPRFGSNADYIALIDSLHGRGIKTVMDMIFNHSGIAHPWLKELPSKDWVNFPDTFVQTNYRLSTITDPYASDFDRKKTTDGWFVAEMPDLNQRNPHLMKYLSQNSIWWIEEAGIDGIRMDTHPYADYEQMAGWIDDVLREYPDFNIVGECWFGTTAGEAFWQKNSPLATGSRKDTNLPTTMDFPFMILSRDMGPFREQTDSWNGLSKVYDHLANDYVYADPMKVLRFLDNHDTERFILEQPDSLGQWKQAVALLLTMPGIPQLYYGTELLMAGDRKKGDGNVRRDMPGGFPGDTTNIFTRQGRSPLQNEAFDFIAQLNHWRRGNEAIARGKMKHFMPIDPLYVYQRGEGKERVVVVMNGSDSPYQSSDMSRFAEIMQPGQQMRDMFTGKMVELIPTGGKSFNMSPRQIMILEETAQ